MLRPATGSLASAVLLLGACSGAPAPIDAPPASAPARSVPSAAASATDAAGPVETEAERRKRLAEAKRSGCQDLAQAMASRGEDVLLNVFNGDTLIAMGGELDESADLVDRVDISADDLPPLAELRAQYTTTSRAMAKALFATAEADGYEERKAPLAEFRELEPKLHVVLSELTAYCSTDAA
ncbi:MAG: hypothetical protein JRI23_24835 [Deltaproteobacteria bacterium]|jgi:hypothetical protein|nr:hypothetical protein [Deltaproteobacteria bacterium]MBW2535239.1 hypothetical protein [Deltaproteobacteria bacterium]